MSAKQEIYPPLRLLKDISNKYPKAWEQMEMFHNENGNPNLGSWPEWCYAPMSAALAVAASGYDLDRIPIDARMAFTSIAQAIFALAPWRLSKEVYVIDPDLKDLLFEQDGELDVPDEILLQLPYPCFYVELPDTYYRTSKIHGFFVTLEYDINNGDRELKPVFLTDDGEVFSYSIHIGAKTISESVDLLDKQALKNTKGDKELKRLAFKAMQESEATKKFLKQILQVILYILAQNAEITPSSEQTFITKRSKVIRDKYSEIRKWDVGIRIGTAIRQQNVLSQTEYTRKEGNGHNSPRPHMRRGHWHHFWTGPKAQPEERKLILKWLSPIAVAVNPEDTPIVIHEVKSNEQSKNP